MTHIISQNKAGIMTLIAFSMPLETPKEIIVPMTPFKNCKRNRRKNGRREERTSCRTGSYRASEFMAPWDSAVTPENAPTAAL